MHRSLRIVPTLLSTSTNQGGAPAPLRYSGELSELLTTPTPTIGARDQLAGKFHDAPQTSPAHMFCTFQHTPANHFASQLTHHTCSRACRPRGMRSWRRAGNHASKCTRRPGHSGHRGMTLEKKVCCKPMRPLTMPTSSMPVRFAWHTCTRTRARRQNA